MADFYLKSGSATERANSTAYAVGAKVVIARADTTANYLVIRKWVMECTTAGTTGAAAPAWPATVTQDTTTVTDGTVVWTFRKPGFSSGTTANWAFSAIFMDYVSTALAAGDRLWVSNNHSESVDASITIAFPGTLASPNQVLCGVDTAAPPTALATTGVVATGNGAYNIALTGVFYCYGISFKCGVGNTANSSRIDLASVAGNQQEYDNCVFEVATTVASTNARIQIGLNSGANNTPGVNFKNCSVKFGSATQLIDVEWANFGWRGGSILVGSAAITTIFKQMAATPRVGISAIDGVDLSVAAVAANIIDVSTLSTSTWTIRDCKLPAAWTGSVVTGAFAVPSQRVGMYNCDSADTNYRLSIADYAGTIVQETTIVRTGGASDGTTTLSWKMASSASALALTAPLVSDEIVRWNDTTAAAITATVEVVHDSQGAGASGAFTNDEIWLEVLYLGTSGVPLGKFVSNGKADVLATAADHPASTATWTTTGLTTPVKQKLSVTFTPQKKGYIHARVHLGKASKTVYVDPKITIV